LSYTARVEAIPVRDEKGKTIAEVVCTSYLLDGPNPISRPVTFAINGGPGSSSCWMNYGAIGPKRVQFGGQGEGPSTPPRAEDNPYTWLPFTDLVFIDAVGTGYSRANIQGKEADRKFFSVNGDITYLSRVIFDWLVLRDRMACPKYIAGESYGGFRAPRITLALQKDLAVGVSGMVLLSPYLEGRSWFDGTDFSPMPWVGKLPSLAAAHLEELGKLTPEALLPVETYARTAYVQDLLQGWNPSAIDRIVKQVSAFTGLDPAFVRKEGGRIKDIDYLREKFRAKGQVGSWHEVNRTMANPFPWGLEGNTDPMSSDSLDPDLMDTTPLEAMVDFLGRTLRWKPQGRYVDGALPARWEEGNPKFLLYLESESALRQTLALDPKLRVIIAHGMTDLACPYFVSKLLLDEIPPAEDRSRVLLKLYPGGHMFYTHPANLKVFSEDVRAMYIGTGEWNHPSAIY
jgi:carboxypeptidase C (cathepsin A)